MSNLVAPTPQRASDADAAAAAGGGAAPPVVRAVAELAGETASPPPATFTAIINIKCPDQTGVVAAVAHLLHGYGINIVETDQFTDPSSAVYFQRLKVDYTLMTIGSANTAVMEQALEELAKRYKMEWSITYSNRRQKVAILVSKDDHCLYDLLIRHRSGELDCDVCIIISNHNKLRTVADMFGIPFVHLPIPPKDQGGKRVQEIQIEEILERESIDLVVLARYMQILTKDFCDKHWKHTINIHHSFLPAFMGAKPYHKAHARGVKIIGATAHYATTDLDAGPIIEQDVTRISHSDSVADMIRKGRDLERLVLARAVRWHLASAVLVEGNKTVVFMS
ncbi:unnamed protein product [Scytosiphon promiscuus]